MSNIDTFDGLYKIFLSAQGTEPSLLASKILACDAHKHYKQVLSEAVMGDNRALNTWLFSDEGMASDYVAWIAPVKGPSPTYVWMLGLHNQTAKIVHSWFENVSHKIAQDTLVNQTMSPPPPLLFVDTVAVSNRSSNSLDGEDEFAIFQTGYKNSPTEVSDHQQRMVINATHSRIKRNIALQNMLKVIDNHEVAELEELKKNLTLYAILHNEGHNRGHFIGSWPHEDSIKKNCVMYEAVEEFRACTGAIVLAESMPMSELQKNSFALSVFMSRFFGFGFEGYLLTDHRRETVREIAVGLMFFEWLVKEGVICYQSDHLKINYTRVRPSLIRAYECIFNDEELVEEYNFDSLKKIARSWYQLAFPNANYTPLAQKVYNTIVQMSDGRKS